jgi:surfeit locus 1 family protein
MLDTVASQPGPPDPGPPYIVWVNRGYVPVRLKDPAARPAGQATGLTRVVGVIRTVGERNTFTPPNDLARNVWFWRDLPALDASAGFTPGTANVAPVMVDAEPQPANPGGWPEGQSGDIKLPNRHFEYALTWYGLAATVIGVFLAFARGRLTRPRE